MPQISISILILALLVFSAWKCLFFFLFTPSHPSTLSSSLCVPGSLTSTCLETILAFEVTALLWLWGKQLSQHRFPKGMVFVKNRVFNKLRFPNDVILETWRAEVTNVLILIPDTAHCELLVFMTLRTLCGLGTINVQCSSVGSSVCLFGAAGVRLVLLFSKGFIQGTDTVWTDLFNIAADVSL